MDQKSNRSVPVVQRANAAARMRHQQRVGDRALPARRRFAIRIVLFFLVIACTVQMFAYLWQQEKRSIREERRQRECQVAAIRPSARASSAASAATAKDCFESMPPQEKDERQ